MSPKSRLPPVQVKGLKFGTGSSSQGSSSGNNSMNKGKNKEEEDGKLPYLDYITCNICNEPFFDGIAKGRIFWMTSCAHVVCNDEAHQHKEGICTVCGKNMQAVTMEEGNLQPIQENFLSNPDTLLEKAVVECENLMKAIQEQFQLKMKNIRSIKGIYKYQNSQHKRPRALYKEQLEKATAEIERLRNEMDVYVTENVELKMANKELQDRLNMPPPPMNGFSPRGTGAHQAAMPPPIYGGGLPTVREEEEENGGEGSDSLGKRRRVEQNDQQYRQLVPSTPISSHVRNQYIPTFGEAYQTPQQVQPQFERSRTVGEYAAPATVTGPSKPDLERYRYNSTPLHGTSPQTYSQGFANGRTTPVQRPSNGFAEAGPSNGGFMGYGNNGNYRQSPPHEMNNHVYDPPSQRYDEPYSHQPQPPFASYPQDGYDRGISPGAPGDENGEASFVVNPPPPRRSIPPLF
ncbi:hypothetical protein I302_109134 [Kwoniella bestiolae CBS 10118]|uniref:RING-type domain-containing protein n=1 Tax=Kwoniella bestiolae CBS 10118 TaxID=1296100 RepID=A0AAJ8KH30_9TREE